MEIAVIFLGLCLVAGAFIFIAVRLYQVKPEFIVKLLKYTLIFIFFIVFSLVSIAIGHRVESRHTSSYSKILHSVQTIWGGKITQQSPVFGFNTTIIKEVSDGKTGEVKLVKEDAVEPMGITSAKMNIQIDSNIRKKGILLFPGYVLKFQAHYTVTNTKNQGGNFSFDFSLPENSGNITQIQVLKDSKKDQSDTNLADGYNWTGFLRPGESRDFIISYQAQGTESFIYASKHQKQEIGELSATIKTDFKEVSYPEGSMVPATINEKQNGKTLNYQYEKLISGQDIAVTFDIEGNYGKYASKLFYYSPLAMFLFLFLILVFSIAKQIRLHPMHFLFILGSFFIFYLLSSYLFSFLNILAALFASLAVSTFIGIYYTVLIKKSSLLVKLTGMGFLIFQWVFSLSFFFPEYTGLIITATGIISFVALLKMTASIEWENKW